MYQAFLFALVVLYNFKWCQYISKEQFAEKISDGFHFIKRFIAERKQND